MSKTTQTEYQKRLFIVQGWIIEGVPSSLIIKKIVDNGWCGERNAERLLQKAREEWTKIPEAEIKQKRQLKIVQLEQMKLSLKPEYKGTPAGIQALMVIEKEIIKLEGIAMPQQHVLSGNPKQPIEQNNKITVEVISTGVPLAHSEDEVAL